MFILSLSFSILYASLNSRFSLSARLLLSTLPPLQFGGCRKEIGIGMDKIVDEGKFSEEREDVCISTDRGMGESKTTWPRKLESHCDRLFKGSSLPTLRFSLIRSPPHGKTLSLFLSLSFSLYLCRYPTPRMKTKTLKRSRSSDDEDRSRSKKPAKSSKRRRRRRDSASSSGDDDRRRRRRRISGGRGNNPGDGRRKESKRPGRKRAAPRRSRYSSPPPPPPSSSVSSYSSRSCSTCRSRSASSSPERYRRAKVRARSRSRGREKEKKRGRSRKATKRSRSCSTCSRSPSRNPSRTRTDERRYKEESDRARRIRSESGVNDAKDEERDKIIQAYDDFPSTRSNEGFDEEKCEKETVSKNIETEPTENVDDVGIVLASEKSKIAVGSENLEADDLELVLRQKALENFKKFRGGVPAKRSSGDHKDVGVVVDAKDATISSIASFQRQGSIQGAKRSSGDHKDVGVVVDAKDAKISSVASFQGQGSIQGGSGPARPRVRSVVSIPTENEGGDGGVSIICPCDNSENFKPIDQTNEAPDTLNQLKRLEGDNNQMPSEQTTVAKDILHNKTAAAEHGSNIGKMLEGSASGTSASVVTKVGNEAAVVEDTTGSQFEQKTFSRMHDGEMVQVSYKVYIPKKTPAMARRQLQR